MTTGTWKTVASGVFQQTGTMNQPPQVLLNGTNLGILEVISDRFNTNVGMKALFSRPANEQDRLFNSAYDHPEREDTCINCNKKQLVDRELRPLDEPQIHY